MDGTTNFSSLSDVELNVAKVGIDPAQRPLDYDNVRIEMARRKDRRRTKLLPIMLRVLGGYLLLGGLATLGTFLSLVPRSPRTTAVVVMVITGLAVSLVVVTAGALLMAKRRLGLFFGVPALALQLVSFSTGMLSYQLVPLYAARLYWSGGNVGFQFLTGPLIDFHYITPSTPSLTVDVIALYGLVLLRRGFRVSRRISQ